MEESETNSLSIPTKNSEDAKENANDQLISAEQRSLLNEDVRQVGFPSVITRLSIGFVPTCNLIKFLILDAEPNMWTSSGMGKDGVNQTVQ